MTDPFIPEQPDLTDPTLELNSMPAPVPEEPAAPAYALPEDISKTKPVYLVNPETSETFAVSNPEKAAALVAGGWGPESKDQYLTRVVGEDVKANPIKSSIEAAAGSFVNQLGLGVPRVVDENVGSAERQAIQKAHNAALEKEHPILTIAGGVTGFADLLLITGGMGALGTFGDGAVKAVQSAAALGGQTAAKVAATTVVKAAVKYGAENVALNLPYRIAENLLGDPKVAGEGLSAFGMHEVEDFGLGSVLGIGTSIVGPALKWGSGLAGKTLNPKVLEEAANTFQFKNAGALTTEFKKLGEITGEKFLPDQIEQAVELLDKHAGPIAQFLGPKAIFKKLSKAKEAAGAMLSTIRNKADALVPESVSFDTLDSALSDVEKEYSKGSIRTGAVPIDHSNFQASVQKYGTDLSKWPTEQPGMNLVDPRTTADLKSIGMVRDAVKSEAVTKMRNLGYSDEQISQALASGQGMPNFSLNEVHDIRQSVKSALYNEGKINGIQTDGGNDAWKMIGQVMDNTINGIAKSAKSPELLNSFSAANKNYRELLNVTDHIIRNAALRAEARNKMGLTANIWGAAAKVAGGNVAGLGGLALGTMKQHVGNYFAYRTLGTAAKALELVTSDVNKLVVGLLAEPAANAAEKAGLGSVSVWSRYMGEKDADPQKAFIAVQNDLAAAQNSPEAMTSALQAIAPNVSEFAPSTYMMMGATTQNAMKYLQDVAPKPPEAIFPGGPTRPWQPTDNELSKYSRRLNAVFNPTSILKELRAGTLTKESVDAVSTVYPSFYSAIQTQLSKVLAEAPAGQVYALRQKLRLILPSNEDPNAKALRIQGLQAGFAPNDNHVKPRANSKIDEAGRYSTNINRISNE